MLLLLTQPACMQAISPLLRNQEANVNTRFYKSSPSTFVKMLNVFQLKLVGALFFFTMVIGVFISRFLLGDTTFPREQELGKNKTK